MTNYSVAILMPTYEPNPAHLREALECVLKQTFQNWTLHIRDDASQTDVQELVAPYLKDPRISFVRNTERKGIGGNWNACLKDVMTTSPESGHTWPRLDDHKKEYIQFLFQDDTWFPNYLETCITALETHQADLCFAEHMYSIEGDEEFQSEVEGAYAHVMMAREQIAPGLQDAKALLRTWIKRGLRPNIIGEPCFVMLRASLVKRVGPVAEDLKQILDIEYWVRCLGKAKRVVYLPGNWGNFRVHAAGTSARNKAARRQRSERLKFFLRHPLLTGRSIFGL